MKQYPRQQRVAGEIQRALATLIRPWLTAAQVARLTISAVEVSRDYRHANVLLSYLGEAEELPPLLRSLNQVAPRLRHDLGQTLRLRSLPELHFRADAHLAQSQRISALFAQLAVPHTPDAD